MIIASRAAFRTFDGRAGKAGVDSFMLIGGTAAALLALAQDLTIAVTSACEVSGPAPIVCGLLDPPGALQGEWMPVRVAGIGGLAGSGVLARGPCGAALHAVVSRIPAGASTLRVSRAAAVIPRAELGLTESGGCWDDGRFRVAFAADGSVGTPEASARLHPVAVRHGRWRAWARDPVRAVVAWESVPLTEARGRPAITLYAVLYAGVPCVDLTLVVRGAEAGAPGALGLAVGSSRGGGDLDPDPPGGDQAESAPDDDREPVEPAFDRVFEDLADRSWAPAGTGPASHTCFVREHGPTSPCRILGGSSRTPRLLAVEPFETPAPGASRVLRLRLFESPAVDAIAMPGRFPRTWPGSSRFAPPSARPDLARLVRKLDAALGVFRTDPRHGLLHRHGDLGDWRLDPFRFGNLEWDTALGFLLCACDSGSRLDAVQALAGVEHLLLRDRDPASGLFFQHGFEHQSGLIEPGHHWAEGIAAVASWSCDPWIDDEARSLARDQVAAFSALDPAVALPRSVGWALTALCALHDFAADRDASRKLIARISRAVRARQSDAGHFQIEESTAREGGFRVSPFVDGGILVPAMARAGRILGDGACDDAARRAADALVRDGVVLEKDGPWVVSSILIERRTGRVSKRAGRAEGEEVLLFLSGLPPGSAGALGGAILVRAADSLGLDDRTHLGKPLSMLMRSLPALAAQGGR